MSAVEKKSGDHNNYLVQLLSLSQLLNSSLQLEEVLEMTIDLVVDFVHAERGFVMLVNDAGELELKAFKNVDPYSIQRMEGVSKTILNTAMEGTNIISVNAQTDPRFSQMHSVMLSGMRSVLAVPLKVQKRIIGLIHLDNKLEDMFNDLQLSMVAAFANQAAIAIENARLHANLIKSYDEQLRLKEELHEQEKMAYAYDQASRAKSDFVNIVSHELRSPLTVIKTYSSLLAKDVKTGRNAVTEEMKIDIYETIDIEVDRLLTMIHKLLDVSRIDAGKPMELDLKKIDILPTVNHVLKLQSTSKFFKKDRHALLRNIPDSLPPVVCDRDKFSQIFSNLVENALKYSPDGGTVEITVCEEDDHLLFAISDQGMGVSPEDQKRLFRKFERMDQSGRTIPGTGLGLYLIKNLVELHGGTINVTSQPGKGSVFCFTMPFVPPSNKVKES